MKMQKFLLAFVAVFFTSLASAKAAGLALGLSAGTLGLGVDAVYGVSDNVNLRLSYRAYDYSTDIDSDGDGDELNYRGDLALDNLGFGVDLHPFGGGFRFSVGVQVSDNRLKGTATCQRVAGCDYGGVNNFLQNGESAAVDIDLTGTHPFLTLGWGNLAAEGRRLGVFFDLGVMLQGTPGVTVTAECNSAPRQTLCDNQADAEEREIQDDADDFEVYPVINLGLRWRFN